MNVYIYEYVCEGRHKPPCSYLSLPFSQLTVWRNSMLMYGLDWTRPLDNPNECQSNLDMPRTPSWTCLCHVCHKRKTWTVVGVVVGLI